MLVLHLICVFTSLPLMLTAVARRWQQRAGNHSALARLSLISFIGLLITGYGLVATQHAEITSACVSGLSYWLCLSGLYVAYRKLGNA
ncbi:MAG TPA: hypothetical protein VG992_01155 [Candidatus Saccharimonadales bacterium]|nr:hypothetical protein [Candidatus Saccharimonadales bacterium]